MQVVCFSYNSPPLNDSEAFCTARLLSALVSEGVDVHLVSIEHERQIDEEEESSLLDRRIAITRIGSNAPGSLSEITGALRYSFHGPAAARIGGCVAAVRRVLKLYRNPCLLTRSSPLVSNVVGYHCRSNAATWVAHFSDPCPGIGMYSRRSYWKYPVDRWWSRRIISQASLVTVTSRNAVRWFSDSLGVDLSPSMRVLYHVGFPHLVRGEESGRAETAEVDFCHVGLWGERRQLKRVLNEFRAAHLAQPIVKLSQYGPMDPGSAESHVEAHAQYFTVCAGRGISPSEASQVMTDADVNVVVDQDDRIEYGPYLASKFAYCIASGRPLLAIGQRDSEMAMLHAEYGGFYFADIRVAGNVSAMVQRIASTPRAQLLRPGSQLKRLFEPATVARGLLDRLGAVNEGRRQVEIHQ